MFHVNQFHTHNNQAFPYEKTVHEHRAPTDESIRIYGELLEKARLSLIDSFRINSILVVDVAVFKKSSSMEQLTVGYYKLNVNKEEITGNVELFDEYDRIVAQRTIANQIIERLSRDVTSELLKRMSLGEVV